MLFHSGSGSCDCNHVKLWIIISWLLPREWLDNDGSASQEPRLQRSVFTRWSLAVVLVSEHHPVHSSLLVLPCNLGHTWTRDKSQPIMNQSELTVLIDQSQPIRINTIRVNTVMIDQSELSCSWLTNQNLRVNRIVMVVRINQTNQIALFSQLKHRII